MGRVHNARHIDRSKVQYWMVFETSVSFALGGDLVIDSSFLLLFLVQRSLALYDC